MNTPTMKAVVCTRYGSPDVLQVREVPKPVVHHNEILIKVKATTVTAADTMMRRADPCISRLFLGFLKPKRAIMGTGFAGIVEAVGSGVRSFKAGDEVFGEAGVRFGANAEYICMPEDGVAVAMPSRISFEEAAPLCDGALTSLNFLKNLGNIRSGQKVLINGASGGLGTAAVQLASYYGAEVTGVCSAANLELVRSLGAHRVIDYATTDFTTTEHRYDLIFDTVGKRSFSQCRRVLSQNGIYLSPVLGWGLLTQMLWTSAFGTRKAKFSATGLLPAPALRALLSEIVHLVETGHLQTVIDRRYSLQQTAEAHRYVDTGHKRGNVVVVV